MTRNVRFLVFACALGLTVLTGFVALDVPVPGDAELVQLVLSTRSDSVTARTCRAIYGSVPSSMNSVISTPAAWLR